MTTIAKDAATPADEAPLDDAPRRLHTAGVAAAVGAIGVVFGDIGTSPLYAFQAALQATAGPAPSALEVAGIVSLIFWALTLVVSLKYVAIVLSADNEGEGGILALVSLVSGAKTAKRRLSVVVLLGVLGAALLYGDGAITPAISVLSAVEGLKVQTPALAPWVIPITLVVLIGLFAVQSRGTGTLGRLFGPIMCAWFGAIAVAGLYGILQAPAILAALSPLDALRFGAQEPAIAFVVFGAAFLALTGAEALYADVGHFGAPPIRLAWFAIAFPALVLNYLGQGALVLAHPDAADNPFYKLLPAWALLPMVLLATVATVIASQALISGVFSLTRQAISMHLLPRMTIVPTSSQAYGQIYVTLANWLLMLATLLIVIGFRSSERLASAYGIAVAGTMLITALLLRSVMRDRWHWHPVLAGAATGLFVTIDAGFFAANAMKLVDGGWLPLAIGAALAFLMIAWRLGMTAVQACLDEGSVPLETFLGDLDKAVVARLPGCAVFVTRLAERASPMLLHQVRHNRVLHEHVILLTIQPTKRPRVPAAERLRITDLGHGFHSVVVSIGFMQRPDIPTALRACARLGLEFCRDEVHFYIAHETLVRGQPSRLPGAVWLAFSVMHRLGLRAADYFHLPPARVMEVGFRLEI